MLTILLPPSEGKATGGRRRPWTPASGRFGRALGDRRQAVADALVGIGGGDARLLGVSGDALGRARGANTTLCGAPTLPAGQRFTGVVWDHLDLGSLDREATRRARQSVLVITALTGVSALDDPLPDFRLKLSVSLPSLGKLSTFWRPEITALLNARLRRRLVIDLLPREHAAAWHPDPSRYDLRRVDFVGSDGRIAGHTAKAAKGLLARALLESDDPGHVLTHWTHPAVSLDVTRVQL